MRHPLLLILVIFIAFKADIWASTASSLEECQADWNRLLVRMQAQDSACLAREDSLRYHLEMESNKSANYQKSWQELVIEVRQCAQRLDNCQEPASEEPVAMPSQTPAPNPGPSRSDYWWAWLLGGILLGGIGAGLAQ